MGFSHGAGAVDRHGLRLSVKFAFWPEDHSVYYPCYETGGQFWSAGKDMYSPGVCPVDFRYGPAAAMALAPFAALPTWLGGLLWIWLNLGVFFASLWALMRRILPGDWTPQRQGVYLGLVLLGTARSLWSGQSNLLIFAMVAMAAAAIVENRWWKAAWLLAIPVHIKAWPLAAGLLLSACRPRALAARLGACLLGVAALPFLTKPFALVCQRYYGWFAVLTGRRRRGSPHVSRRLDDLGTVSRARPAQTLPGDAIGHGGARARALPLAGPPQPARPAAVAVRPRRVGVLANGLRTGDRAKHLRPVGAADQLGVDYGLRGEAGASR